MTLMMIAASATQQIYEVLAFVVALFFPVALLTWLVIDKFMPASDDRVRVVQRASSEGHNHVLADHSQPRA